jgi:hypothetical protein
MAGVTQRNYSGSSLEATQQLQNYQDSITMGVGTNLNTVNSMAAQYYAILENYLSPTQLNLELAQNISSKSIYPGSTTGGQSSYYEDSTGNGYVDNLGYLGNNVYPSVSYGNDRMAELSNCAKDLPMFAASSLLPKASTNADNNALSQDAARALSAFTALSPVEQIGGITSIKTPYSKLTDLRAVDGVNIEMLINPAFGGSSSLGINPTTGAMNSKGQPGANGFRGN